MGCVSSGVSPDSVPHPQSALSLVPTAGANAKSNKVQPLAAMTSTSAGVKSRNTPAPVTHAQSQDTLPTTPPEQQSAEPSRGPSVPTAMTSVENLSSGLIFSEGKQSSSTAIAANDLSNLFSAIKRGNFSHFKDIIIDSYGGLEKESEFFQVHFVKGMWDSTPAIVAMQYQQIDMVLYLLDHLPPALPSSSSHLHTRSIDSSIDSSILNHRNEKGASCLLYAVMDGRVDIVQRLLSLAVVIDKCPSKDAIYNPLYDSSMIATPLSLAVVNGHAAIVALLIGAGSDVNTVFDFPILKSIDSSKKQGVKGLTPLLLACFYAHSAVVDCLLEFAESLDSSRQDDDSCNALHLLSRSKSSAPSAASSIAQSLLTRNMIEDGMFQQRDSNGDTVLHVACDNKQEALARLWLEQGSNPSSMNSRTGFTPLHLAIRRRSLDLVVLLLEFGADVYAKLESKANSASPWDLAEKLATDNAIRIAMQKHVQTLTVPMSVTASEALAVESEVAFAIVSDPAPVTEVGTATTTATEAAKVLTSNPLACESSDSDADDADDSTLLAFHSISNQQQQSLVSTESVIAPLQRTVKEVVVHSVEQQQQHQQQQSTQENIPISGSRSPAREDAIARYMAMQVFSPALKSTQSAVKTQRSELTAIDTTAHVHESALTVNPLTQVDIHELVATPKAIESAVSANVQQPVVDTEGDDVMSFDAMLMTMLSTGQGDDVLEEYLKDHTQDYSQQQANELAQQEQTTLESMVKEADMSLIDLSVLQDASIIARHHHYPAVTSTRSRPSVLVTVMDGDEYDYDTERTATATEMVNHSSTSEGPSAEEASGGPLGLDLDAVEADVMAMIAEHQTAQPMDSSTLTPQKKMSTSIRTSLTTGGKKQKRSIAESREETSPKRRDSVSSAARDARKQSIAKAYESTDPSKTADGKVNPQSASKIVPRPPPQQLQPQQSLRRSLLNSSKRRDSSAASSNTSTLTATQGIQREKQKSVPADSAKTQAEAQTQEAHKVQSDGTDLTLNIQLSAPSMNVNILDNQLGYSTPRADRSNRGAGDKEDQERGCESVPLTPIGLLVSSAADSSPVVSRNKFSATTARTAEAVTAVASNSTNNNINSKSLAAPSPHRKFTAPKIIASIYSKPPHSLVSSNGNATAPSPATQHRRLSQLKQ